MQNNESFEVQNQHFQLQRYPYKNNDELRAWDAADLYLLNTILDRKEDLQNTCIVNDNFGALTLPLLQYSPICYSDSYLSKEAVFRNIALNQVNVQLNFFETLEALSSQPCSSKLIIGRVPKTKLHLQNLLQHLQKWAPAGSTLLLAGMDKHLSKSQFDLLERNFGQSRFHPGVKKARIWEATLDKSIKNTPLKKSIIEVPEFGLTLSNRPNVFSQEKLDIGSRFFLDNLSKLPEKKFVADMACGNGVLGLAYLTRHPNAEILFTDESFQAIQSCQENWQENLPSAHLKIEAGDGLKSATPASLELVICNPPFHHLHTVGTDIAFSLFKDAHKALINKGELWVVANRHLGYHITLKKLFGNCDTAASNQKFVILKAVKKSSF